MINGWLIVTVALTYVGFLFAVAYFGDKYAKSRKSTHGRPTIYALSLAVYCTSWTFFGSVGLATTTGLDFLAVYLGPIAVFAFGRPLIERIIKLSKSQNITSIADFMAARYGKSPAVAAIVTVIAVAGVLPYIALQLKAVSQSVATIVQPGGYAPYLPSGDPFSDVTFIIAMIMAVFAALFGTRHIDATEHQEGLMLAIAAESVVKIATFLIVGSFITYSMFGGVGPLIERAAEYPEIIGLFARGFHGGNWITVTFLSSICILLLTRQFHVTIVENNSEREVGRASWLFPLYLIAINIFVIPIAIAGMLTFPPNPAESDMFLLKLPLSQGAGTFTILAFLGGLSAATAMVIMESIALSIMVCNDLVIPIILRRMGRDEGDLRDMGTVVLYIRRFAIFGILLLAYLFYRVVGDTYGLARIGLLSFAAIAQFAPAFFGGLVWRGATARGAIAGILSGFAVWIYTLLVPYFVEAGLIGPDIMRNGPFGLHFLRPDALFGVELDSLTHGVIWSMLVNITAYVVVSMLRAPEPIERLQANIFIENDFARATVPSFRAWRTSVTVGDLMRTVGRYLGEERTHRSFADYAATHNMPLAVKAEADIHMMRFAENLLASAIGSASSRLVMSLTLRRHDVGMKSALKLLDDASEAIQYNRDLLQSALDHVHQGIAVFDRNMQLICWNREFREMLQLPAALGRVGVPLDQIVRHMAAKTAKDATAFENFVSNRIRKYVVTLETFHEKLDEGKRVIEVRTNAMPQGGIVTTFTDITERVAAASALERANETLERRVRERTAELTTVNLALAEAKIKADEANLDKTRFLAAASHDILQPLNAARLYTTSLVERKPPGDIQHLSRNIDASLEAVEEILNALLDIARLDTGALKPEIGTFAIGELLQQLKVEFEPQASEKGLELLAVPCSLYVRSDRRLLRRVLQNFLSNAVKYTGDGRVLLGCRRSKDALTIEVHDTGSGIPENKHELIFKEFHRLNTGMPGVHGIGLGLSIVERIGRMLDHPIHLSSKPGEGSVFGVTLPISDRAAADRQVSYPMATQWGYLTGCIVLCVDNEPAILDGMRTLLENWQCKVLQASDTIEALQIVEETGATPDIILADYHLEHETGIDCIDAVRKQAGYTIPAVLITADRSPGVEEEARGGELQLLRKPIKPAALRALMTRLHLQRQAAE
ncbi:MULTISPECIES: PAS domain-containing hybrid sensor histidine kinase/response regulator [Rhodomicrobium]|uniref:PAS domain-containing hybrid sensor histidine kinase/response regulator n=1 Tax=Rhodomicrobium TaxID=1068 RepID=UPI000B4AECAD|nr:MULTISPECIES: PAS domain-containing hybrid sensor histidine kinase/response regulator [Rhodomicrobium]